MSRLGKLGATPGAVSDLFCSPRGYVIAELIGDASRESVHHLFLGLHFGAPLPVWFAKDSSNSRKRATFVLKQATGVIIPVAFKAFCALRLYLATVTISVYLLRALPRFIMRLLRTKTLEFGDFLDSQLPTYAILSHRWGEHEVSYKEMRRFQKEHSGSTNEERYKAAEASGLGMAKIKNFCQKALSHGYDWGWIDTCCIDKRSSAELSEVRQLSLSRNFPQVIAQRLVR